MSLPAQQTITSDKFKISFTAPEDLEYFKLDTASLFGYDSDNYSVVIEVVPIEWESDKFLVDLGYGAKEIASDMGFKKITPIGKIPGIENSHYVSSILKDNLGDVPLYVIAMLNMSQRTAFEISVYCYNLDMNAGEEMVRSFRLTN
jgi:hypothetical protein